MRGGWRLKLSPRCVIILPPEAMNFIGGTEKGFFLVSFVMTETAEQPKLSC